MKRVSRPETLALVLVLVCGGSAFAENPYSYAYPEWEVSGFSGPAFSGSSFQFSTPVFGSDQQSSRTIGMSYDEGYLLGMRVTKNVNDYWAANLEYTFTNQEVHFTNISPIISNISMNSYIHDISYNVLILGLPRTKRFRPYGDAGVGLAGFYVGGQGKRNAAQLGVHLRDSWTFLFNWGGGLKYLITDEMALTFDARDRVSSVPSYGLPSSAQVVNRQFFPGIAQHGVLQSWQINVGLSYLWNEY